MFTFQETELTQKIPHRATSFDGFCQRKRKIAMEKMYKNCSQITDTLCGLEMYIHISVKISLTHIWSFYY